MIIFSRQLTRSFSSLPNRLRIDPASLQSIHLHHNVYRADVSPPRSPSHVSVSSLSARFFFFFFSLLFYLFSPGLPLISPTPLINDPTTASLPSSPTVSRYGQLEFFHLHADQKLTVIISVDSLAPSSPASRTVGEYLLPGNVDGNLVLTTHAASSSLL